MERSAQVYDHNIPASDRNIQFSDRNNQASNMQGNAGFVNMNPYGMYMNQNGFTGNPMLQPMMDPRNNPNLAWGNYGMMGPGGYGMNPTMGYQQQQQQQQMQNGFQQMNINGNRNGERKQWGRTPDGTHSRGSLHDIFPHMRYSL